jgi:hypothetical protein
LGGGNGFVAFFNALEKLGTGLFHAVGYGGAGAAAGLADGDGEHKEEGEVGASPADGEGDYFPDLFGIESAAMDLIGDGGIEKAVAEDNLAGGEGGTDDLTDELGAAGVEEEKLGLGGHVLIGFAVLEGVADFFADGGAARFAQNAHGAAKGAEAFGKGGDLGGFAAAFGAFEGDADCELRIADWLRCP